MVFRVVTWIITAIIGAVRALCPRCAKTPPMNVREKQSACVGCFLFPDDAGRIASFPHSALHVLAVHPRNSLSTHTLLHAFAVQPTPPPRASLGYLKTKGGGDPSPKTPSPPPQTKVTIVGKNEIYNRENLVRPFLVHQVLGPKPPPPLPPPLLKRSPAPPPLAIPPPPKGGPSLGPKSISNTRRRRKFFFRLHWYWG